ncbi:MAG: ZIP family metal transporter [Alphaproteobacteria bacterium]|nr:ZIP family metal transporter [Alphaproteobacteria bacterium]MDE2495398.1 ZIP family metal transporter [Alphaproteobacteria bacterium]
MIIPAIALGAFCATMAGGLVALRFRDKLHLILGFSAGAVVGVAFFDIIPEALALGDRYYSSTVLLAYVAFGFLIYLVLDRLALLHSEATAHDGHQHYHEHAVLRGLIGAGSLSLHSFLDGAAIGLGFQVSTAVGAVIAIAVLTHDFSDGVNTMNLVLKNGGGRAAGLRWLLLDAVAPVAGIASTFLFALPDRVFGTVLALFGGFFLYIGASDLVPESHHAHPKFLTTIMTLLGAAVIYLAVSFAGL